MKQMKQETRDNVCIAMDSNDCKHDSPHVDLAFARWATTFVMENRQQISYDKEHSSAIGLFYNEFCDLTGPMFKFKELDFLF